MSFTYRLHLRCLMRIHFQNDEYWLVGLDTKSTTHWGVLNNRNVSFPSSGARTLRPRHRQGWYPVPAARVNPSWASPGFWQCVGCLQPSLAYRHITLISALFAGALPVGFLGPSFPFEEDTWGPPCCSLTLS